MGTILVACGTNGAGKSSIVQPFLEASGGAYFNPDLYTRSLLQAGLSHDEANSRAWARGFEQLVEAVDDNLDYAFETTLGGHAIALQLMRAVAMKRHLILLYVGLDSVDLHLRRVRERVARGGHDIPEQTVRRRYDESRKNLLWFMGTAATIRVWDNSVQISDGTPSAAKEVLAVRHGKLQLRGPISGVPAWARPFVARARRVRLL
jgi:predicted ABC-type ATPase